MIQEKTILGAVCCPQCRAPFTPAGGEGSHACPSCGAAYAVQDGIIDFTPADRFYWGEIGREEMERVNRRAAQGRWFDVVLEDVVRNSKRDLSGYLFDPVRAAGLFHYYDPQRNEAALDLGSGWGPISFGLSRYYKTVYSLDGVLERLQFQAIRARQDGVKNVKIFKGSMLRLPFSDGSMDVVVVNGLLEWIGLSDSITPPRDLQLVFLREVHRVLKPDGKIFIGIENRTGIQFFFGSHDHSGLPFTSVMPRRMADITVRLARRDRGALVFSGAESAYRTLTYTRWGYAKLVKEAGFGRPEFYWAWPSYNFPYVSGPLHGSSIKYYLNTVERENPSRVRRLLLQLAARLPAPLVGLLIRIFSPHFLIVAGRSEAVTDGLQERVLAEKKGAGSYLRMSQGTGRNLKAEYLLVKNRELKGKINVRSEPHNGRMDFVIQTEQYTSGCPMQSDSPAEARLAAAWLLKMQRETRSGDWPPAAAEAEIRRLENAAQALGLEADTALLLDQYVQYYDDCLRGLTLPLVEEQGEFCPENMLVENGRRVRLVHWDEHRVNGNPLLDAGRFYLALLRFGSSGQMLSGALPNAAAAQAFAVEYNSQAHLPLQLAPAYAALRMLERETGGGPLTADNFVAHRRWMRLLKPALQLALQEPRAA